MHVAFAADGRRIAELFRYAFNRSNDVALGLCLAVVLLDSANASAASTVPAQVRKSFALKSSPVMSLMYALTSPESTLRGSPSSPRYLNSSCPGMSAQRLTIEAIRLSSTRSFHFFPDLPVNSNRRTPRPIATCLRRGQSVAFVLLSILGVADTDECLFQKADDRGQHPLAGQSFQLSYPRRPAPGARARRPRTGRYVRTCSHRAALAIWDGIDIVCAHAHRDLSPVYVRWLRDRSRRIRRPGGYRST
ncbi:hypothetical protein ABIF62_003083 [Bradyrhizobium japonicum]